MTKEEKDLRSVITGIIVGAIVGLAIFAGMALGQSIMWRLVGSTFNGNGTMTCVYEGRLSNGQVIHQTTIEQKTYCPMTPGGF